jgi:hypothetical protein
MSRIFTTKFSFNARVYDAFITMVTKDGNASFAIKLTDPDLHHLIPDGEIRYHGKEGFKKLELMQNEPAQSLVICISEAIEDHLMTVPVK